MRLHRFIFSADLSARRLTVKDGAVLHQLTNVFRLGAGDVFLICDGNGVEAEARIVSITKRAADVEISHPVRLENEPMIRGVLYLALLKRENFELAVQKATEAGIAEIVPLVTKRTVKLGIKPERLELIAREAAEQSGRGRVPEIRSPVAFLDALANSRTNDANFFFHADAPAFPPKSFSPKRDARIGAFIGPEGGWDPDEFAAMAAQPNMDLASLGPLTLRAETAAIIASYLVTNTLYGRDKT